MADSKSSVKENSDSSKKDLQPTINELEAWELGKHRLQNLKVCFDEYLSQYNSYLQRHYLIVASCIVVIFFGVIVALLKFDGDENLAFSFKALQSSFASILSGGGIIGFGSRILFSDKKKLHDGISNDEPNSNVIRLCVSKDLGEKLDGTIRKLREKREDLERAMSWQSIWAILCSIFALVLVGVDFFGLLPKTKYIDIGLDVILSVSGLYFLYCTCMLYAILSNPRKDLEQNHLTLFLFVIPCALADGLMVDDETRTWAILKFAFRPWASKGKHWIKEVYLSPDEKFEISYLLRGLNPDVSHLKVKKFCEELRPEDINEKTRLNAKSKSGYNSIESESESGRELTFIELVNQIESEATQKVNEKYFNLGEALAKCLETCSHSIHGEPLVKVISENFPSHQVDVRKVYKHYFECEKIERGITLEEFFDKHPSKNLFGEFCDIFVQSC